MKTIDSNPHKTPTILSQRSALNISRTSNVFEQEVIDLLAKTRNGNLSSMREKIKTFTNTQTQQIGSDYLISAIAIEGGLGEFEARKVVAFFEVRGKLVSVPKFEDYLSTALEESYHSSTAYQKFVELCRSDRADSLV